MDMFSEQWLAFPPGELLAFSMASATKFNIAEFFERNPESIMAIFETACGVYLEDDLKRLAISSGLQVVKTGGATVLDLANTWAQIEGLAEFAAGVSQVML